MQAVPAALRSKFQPEDEIQGAGRLELPGDSFVVPCWVVYDNPEWENWS